MFVWYSSLLFDQLYLGEEIVSFDDELGEN